MAPTKPHEKEHARTYRYQPQVSNQRARQLQAHTNNTAKPPRFISRFKPPAYPTTFSYQGHKHDSLTRAICRPGEREGEERLLLHCYVAFLPTYTLSLLLVFCQPSSQMFKGGPFICSRRIRCSHGTRLLYLRLCVTNLIAYSAAPC